MLGMNQIRKKMLIGFSIGLLIGVIIAGISIAISVVTVKGYQDGTSKEFIERYQREVTCFTRDIIQGEKIKDDMVQQVLVHIKNVPEDATSAVIGMVAKYNIPKSIPITSGMVTEQLIAKDVRAYETNSILIPSDAVEGDTIDIRIMYASGIDYVVIPQVRIDKIQDTTLYFTANEEELLMLDSAMVDSYLYSGTKLYAIRYADPDSQVVYGEDNSEELMKEKIYNELDVLQGKDKDSAIDSFYGLVEDYHQLVSSKGSIEINYQPNEQVQALMRTRPNIVQEAKDRLSEESRLLIEARIEGFSTAYEEDFGKLTTSITSSVTEQKSLRQKLIQAQEAEAAAAPAPEVTEPVE